MTVVVLLVAGHEPDQQGRRQEAVALDDSHRCQALVRDLPVVQSFRLPDEAAEALLHFCFRRILKLAVRLHGADAGAEVREIPVGAALEALEVNPEG